MNDPAMLPSPDPHERTHDEAVARPSWPPVPASRDPHECTQDQRIQDNRTGHETTDASPFYIGLFALGLTVMVALVLPLLGWVFWQFEAAARRADPPQSNLSGKETPPSPLLQDNPAADLAQFRRGEEERLSSYGWVDAKKRIVHLPIERAIDVLCARGLPEPEGQAEPPAKGEPVP